MKKKKKNP